MQNLLRFEIPPLALNRRGQLRAGFVVEVACGLQLFFGPIQFLQAAVQRGHAAAAGDPKPVVRVGVIDAVFDALVVGGSD